MTKVSFIIPALNEEKNVGKCILSISQYMPKKIPYEILVGDHGSSDETARIAEEAGAVVFLVKGGTVGALRNYLVGRSEGEIIVFIDADVTVSCEWGKEISHVIDDVILHQKQITGSRCSVPNGDNCLLKYWFSKIPVADNTYLGTGHMIIPRISFDELRGFDETLRSGEDYDICERAKSMGYEVRVRSYLKVVHHDYPLSLSGFLRREMWHGSGDFQSFSRAFSSKVAVMTMLFLVVNLLIILSALIASRQLFFFSIAMLLGMLAISSIIKFKNLKLHERVINILIFYFYFLGRAASLVVK